MKGTTIMEFNKPVSNPMLIGAIEVMKADPSIEHKNLFINEMMKGSFLSPVVITPEPIKDEEGEYKITPENRIQFPMLTAADGKHYFMAFTDKIEFDKWKKNEGFTFALTVDDYAHMSNDPNGLSAGFVINPYGANIVIVKEMLASLMAVKEGKKPAET